MPTLNCTCPVPPCAPDRRHFSVAPAKHDVDRTKPKAPEELGLSATHLAVAANIEGDDAGDVAKVRAIRLRKVAVQGLPWTLSATLLLD